MKLIVGLGNPGKQYAGTRHSVGFAALDYFVHHNKWPHFSNQDKWPAELSEQKAGTEKILLIKPQAYMNNSGQVVKKLADFYKVDLNNLLVIYDELALAFGKVRLREGGSSAGHNGIKSLIGTVGDGFMRLRIGIDAKRPAKQSHQDFVLARFSIEEEQSLPHIFDYTNHVIHQFISGDKLEAHTENCLPKLI